MCGDEQCPFQVAWALLQRQVPSRTPHLLCAHPIRVINVICDQLQAEFQEAIRLLASISPPPLTDQWKIAELPITSGALWGACVSQSTLPGGVSTHFLLGHAPGVCGHSGIQGGCVDIERPELFGKLPPLIGPIPFLEVEGDVHNAPPGKSFARLPKKLTHFRYTLCCNELWAKRQTLPNIVRYARMHN